ncbi:MAG: M20/M25/M40 family metallo-hydrolase [Oscillospiraceae bacterium]|nr:M20/M25/M40 family metallo-hydrolase [Oscillospiraceae bacterium]
MYSLKDILKKLYKTKSPSGFEGETASVIAEIAESAGLSCELDALGNLIVRRPGVGKKVLIDAHMDTTGFLATYVDEKGFIRFDALGGLSVAELHNTPIVFLNGTRGTVSYEQKTEIKDRKISSMFIDIGADSAESAKKHVLPGDAAIFAGELCELSENRICAPYLDNRLGCAIALYAIINLKNCEYDIYAVFSVQEEVGCRGARTAAYLSDADFAIVLDVTDSCDSPGFDGYGETKLSGGTAIKIMDKAVIAHPTIVSAMIECAEKNKIPYQRDIVTVGGTDGGSIHLTQKGIPTGGISVPVRYMHSPCEIADMSDVENSAKLLSEILETQAIIF